MAPLAGCGAVPVGVPAAGAIGRRPEACSYPDWRARAGGPSGHAGLGRRPEACSYPDRLVPGQARTRTGGPKGHVGLGRRPEAIIDVKLVDEKSNPKRTIASGFRQVAAYCRARSEPVGYLLVYATIPLDIVLVDGSSDDSFPCVRLGECTVYYVLVDIADSPSASKKPKAREIVITREDLNHADADSLEAM